MRVQAETPLSPHVPHLGDASNRHVSAILRRQIKKGDLNGKFDVIIFPDDSTAMIVGEAGVGRGGAAAVVGAGAGGGGGRGNTFAPGTVRKPMKRSSCCSTT